MKMDHDIGLMFDVGMPEKIREMLLVALSDALYGAALEPSLIQAVASGDRALTIDQVEFDSLAWMEFCISVEGRSGQELTPVHIVSMQYFFEIEEWLRARV
jgi:hypothetical protein